MENKVSLLSLGSGKMVYMDGPSITQEEALEIAARLCETWGQVHPEVKARVMYEYDVPKGDFSECPHLDTKEEALEELERIKKTMKGK